MNRHLIFRPPLAPKLVRRLMLSLVPMLSVLPMLLPTQIRSPTLMGQDQHQQLAVRWFYCLFHHENQSHTIPCL